MFAYSVSSQSTVITPLFMYICFLLSSHCIVHFMGSLLFISTEDSTFAIYNSNI